MHTGMAWERLNGPEAADLGAEAYLELCLAAGYSEEVAQRSATRRGFERAKRELPA